jgi:hypothetical protein
MISECRREADVLEAVGLYRWPDRCEEELRTHVAGCAVCREVADVALVFRDDHAAHTRDVRIPSAERVWWRAQLRARIDDAELAARPMSVMQGAAAAAGGGLAVAGATFLWPRLPWDVFYGIYEWLPGFAAGDLTAAVSSIPQLLLVTGLGAAAAIVLMPLALYFVLSE